MTPVNAPPTGGMIVKSSAEQETFVWLTLCPCSRLSVYVLPSQTMVSLKGTVVLGAVATLSEMCDDVVCVVNTSVSLHVFHSPREPHLEFTRSSFGGSAYEVWSLGAADDPTTSDTDGGV